MLKWLWKMLRGGGDPVAEAAPEGDDAEDAPEGDDAEDATYVDVISFMACHEAPEVRALTPRFQTLLAHLGHKRTDLVKDTVLNTIHATITAERAAAHEAVDDDEDDEPFPWEEEEEENAKQNYDA